MIVYIDMNVTDFDITSGIWELGAILIKNNISHEFQILCKPTGTTSQTMLDFINSRDEYKLSYEISQELSFTDNDCIKMLSNWIETHRADGNKFARNEIFFSYGKTDFSILRHKCELLNIPYFWNYGSECDLKSIAKFHDFYEKLDRSKLRSVDSAKAMKTYHENLLEHIQGIYQ